jgi:hypothetical protein
MILKFVTKNGTKVYAPLHQKEEADFHGRNASLGWSSFRTQFAR